MQEKFNSSEFLEKFKNSKTVLNIFVCWFLFLRQTRFQTANVAKCTFALFFVYKRLWGILLSGTSQDKNKDRKLAKAFFQLPLYRWCSFTEQFSILWLSAYHLSKLPWSKGYLRHSKVCRWP